MKDIADFFIYTLGTVVIGLVIIFLIGFIFEYLKFLKRKND